MIICIPPHQNNINVFRKIGICVNIFIVVTLSDQPINTSPCYLRYIRQPDNAGAAGSVSRQIRSDEEEVSEGTSQSPLLQSSDELHPDRTLGGDRAESLDDGGNADKADGGEGRNHGEPESGGYDVVGSKNEQFEEPGAGDRESGSNLRLVYDRQHEDKSLPFFGGDDTINERFNNLPELMAMFKEVADIKTADMLDLPVPEALYHNIAVKPSQLQKDMVSSLAERAEAIRAGGVDSRVDNMLKITNDGRKLALDQRMLNEMLPDDESSKVNACINEVYRIWEESTDKRSTQLLFCDLSTPKGEGVFSVYTDIRKKLIERGIPESEIKFIHEADTEAKKQELFKKVRKGEVRILLGSTAKMGAGTNVQNKIIASHDIDCPWRPSDLEQRAGRTVRQGNENPKSLQHLIVGAVRTACTVYCPAFYRSPPLVTVPAFPHHFLM